MTLDQFAIFAILTATVGMFLWGKWRHDMVALGSLIACVLARIVPSADAFAGFGHPAVITVAGVLVLSRGLQSSGAVDSVTRRLLPASAGPTVTIGALAAIAAVLSAFMNNVGALALLMPAAIQIAQKLGLPPGRVLMPLSFGTILGGMTTLIGTPPNLIVSGFRGRTEAGSFAMFDFAPVGVAVAVAGVAFVALIGWRLVPARERAGTEDFATGAYLTEAVVPEDGKTVGKTIQELGQMIEADDAQIVGLVRNAFRVSAPNPRHTLRAGDILVIEAEPKSLAHVVSSLGLKLVEAVPAEKPAKEPKDSKDPAETPANSSAKNAADATSSKPAEKPKAKSPDAGEQALVELAVRPDAQLIGRSATDILLRTRYGLNLLALSRQGRRSIQRLRSQHFRAGDVLLLQGEPDAVSAFAAEFGCVPLAERAIRVPARREAVLATAIMGAAVAGAAFGLMPAALAFAAGGLAVMAFKVVPPLTVYQSIDWSVIVLLGALIPVAGAMETTGAADLLAQQLLSVVAQGNAVVALTVLLIVTMCLSDFMNNAATAAVMCPIALSTATQLEVNADSFLMAVAIGASCAFLTPIGHQNNTLILGPGGLRFGDYWRLGLPLELLVAAVSIPALLHFWPL
jgi:di/tricarboxylate transporter